jgi:serine/threonine protein phosphatase 1
MSKRTIAIGDVHGCSLALAAVLDVIAPGPDDTIVSLGDYVDRGPDSAGVIELMLELGQRARLVPLLGNHELMMLSAIEHGAEHTHYWLVCGGHETLDSYGGALASVPSTHVDFLRSLRRFHETSGHIFVHANYDANLALTEQPDYLLFWEHLSYRPPVPQGSRGHRRRDRWAAESESRPAVHHSGKTVFVGHTPQVSGNVLDLGHVVCIDTACFLGGYLTAIDVDSRQIWQADMHGNLRDAT